MEKIAVESIISPGHVTRVDAAKYMAMKHAILCEMSDRPMTAAQMKTAALPHLPDTLFPGGKTAGWWLKCVQLDLEAKGVIRRHDSKPLTWSKS